jgi:hypothetical protein
MNRDFREDELEAMLRDALKREQAPSDFADRVLARSKKTKVVTMPRWLAPAAAVIVMMSGGLAYRHYEGVKAKEQVMEATRLTAEKLRQIRQQVREVRP